MACPISCWQAFEQNNVFLHAEHTFNKYSTEFVASFIIILFCFWHELQDLPRLASIFSKVKELIASFFEKTIFEHLNFLCKRLLTEDLRYNFILIFSSFLSYYLLKKVDLYQIVLDSTVCVGNVAIKYSSILYSLSKLQYF